MLSSRRGYARGVITGALIAEIMAASIFVGRAHAAVVDGAWPLMAAVSLPENGSPRTLGFVVLAGVGEPAFVCEDDRLDSVSDSKLAEHSGHVCLDGGLAQEQPLCDLDV